MTHQKKEPYEARIHIRMSSEQREMFDRVADRSGYRTTSDWARAVLVTIAKKFESKGETR